MANGKVEDLAFSQLRPRRTFPQCVIDSIPPEDMQAFLRLVAVNPFIAFADASAVRKKIVKLRSWRAEAANPNTVTIPLYPAVDIMHSKEFSVVQPLNKRKRPSYAAADTNGEATGLETDSENDEQPRRKQRRSSRPALSSSGQAQDGLTAPSERDEPKIGEQYQADVPAAPLTREDWKKAPLIISSKLVFSEQKCGGHAAVSAVLGDVNADIKHRDGYELAPFALEVALQLMYQHRVKGPELAKKLVLEKVPRGPYFPGIKAPFRYEEQCLFVRTLGERAKNFLHISRDVLPERTPSELVWLYYTRHKQLWLQNGGMKDGQILDDGGEKLKRVALTAERTVSALRSLATTAMDGFPVDSRVNLAESARRRGNLAKRRKEREDESFRGISRLRSQNGQR